MNLDFSLPSLVTSTALAAATSRFILLVALSLFFGWSTINLRIGSIRAVRVMSYPRFLTAFILCNGVCVAGYQAALLVHPTSNWVHFLLFIPATLGAYIVCGLATCGIGVALDRGRALRVMTDAYRRTQFNGADGVDLTKNFGETAQLIPRAANQAFGFGLLGALITACVLLFQH